MVSWWTWILKFKCIFILAWNYNGFVVDMYLLDRVHIRLRACIQRDVFVMHFEYLQNRIRFRTRVTIVMLLIAWRFEEWAPFSYTCRN